MDKYLEFAKNCTHQFLDGRLCKVRDKSLRDCVAPKCCSVCPKIDYCPGICKPMIDEFNIDIEERREYMDEQ